MTDADSCMICIIAGGMIWILAKTIASLIEMERDVTQDSAFDTELSATKAALAERDSVIDLLEKNACVQAKLLADTKEALQEQERQFDWNFDKLESCEVALAEALTWGTPNYPRACLNCGKTAPAEIGRFDALCGTDNQNENYIPCTIDITYSEAMEEIKSIRGRIAFQDLGAAEALIANTQLRAALDASADALKKSHEWILQAPEDTWGTNAMGDDTVPGGLVSWPLRDELARDIKTAELKARTVLSLSKSEVIGDDNVYGNQKHRHPDNEPLQAGDFEPAGDNCVSRTED